MNDIISLSYNGSNIRTAEKDGQLWWVLADVCKVLELSNPSRVAERLDDDEKANFELGLCGGATNVINESGLYSVILRSDKPQAKPFRRWVTHEVLPQIRQNGCYIARAVPVTEKTWYGERVLTMNDAAAVLGIDRRSARNKILAGLRDGLDYFVLRGGSLLRFRFENPEFAGKSLNSVLLIRYSAFVNAFSDFNYRPITITR